MAPMTLRVRLVIALTVLVMVGLAVFGVTTYSLYAHSQYQRLDDQLVSASPSMSHQLSDAAGFGPGGGGLSDDRGGRGGGPPVVAPLTVYGELRSASGSDVLAELSPSNLTIRPALPAHVTASTQPHLSTVGSTSGSVDWRVLVQADPAGHVVIVAVPQSDVQNTLRRLILIEGLAALGLLVVLAGG